MKQVFVESIQERDWVESPFLVRDKIMAMAKNGKPYMTLKLMDRTGEIEGRVWDRVDEFATRFEKDDFILAKGKASVYLGKMQLVVQDLERLTDEQIDLSDFLPVSERLPEDMERELHAKVASLEDGHLRRLLESFFADEDFLRRYRTAPAAKAMHHVYLGGLLEHSLAVADLVDDICRRYPGLNRDLLVAGALLHDVGKVDELCYERSFDYTDEGKLIGHIVMGVELVDEKIRAIPGFPPRLAMLLKHLLLSHHGQYEYGSPKRPKIIEAVILNFLDDLDSKINGVRTHMEREPDSPSGWTAYHRLYDRYFFKDSFGAEAAAPAAVEGPAPAVKPQSAAKPQTMPGRAVKSNESRSRGASFTLGDQLRGKSLDLFSTQDDKE
ncbi:metal dependent phosphohydrolase [Geoalkalibacter ferrihydriticus]|uniref:HD family phosphohydrolase n=2 Tax=Geoalkalibacter ferrihydriticus TaxID=392333 RepID=A0A0C2HIS4_9BACT|nr:HD domain-containing protein [Geoalkalibacter ferrihydriticus]KIH76956.1 HD family phosphohydrolase [Geoalkalibacter ferrihydriticus DSM 17813]SDL42572.1 metal dependent phosphohydrolase [Geoalkalibacter ferrihydriticus]